MKGQTNNPSGRPTKGNEKRKAVSFRLQPSSISAIRLAAARMGFSQSDYVEYLLKESQLLNKGQTRLSATD